MNAIVSDPAVKSPRGDAGSLGRERQIQQIYFATALGTKGPYAGLEHWKRSHVLPVNRNLNATPVLHRRFRLACPPSGPLVQ